MANSNKDLKDFVLNKENVFEMKFNEFQSLFLSKLRLVKLLLFTNTVPT